MGESNTEMNENCALVSKWLGENEPCLNADKTHGDCWNQPKT